ncbi:bifunctional adenosylcobinamide kinase/adenosylcobinamide-phosphate guanylyltransferase [Novosphingobium umbonatum]|uniref:Bifunctional adenosylcobalamin biosynthesis protein n=1 Tax=Novosphingobium umbonatum TaxID=1908524 RepID=A0A3S2VEC7_9SPHN|nr:bifunctional adenosylcobinamide kinase/adenosylcobinamide-phosphate guanylyltransferase [Novosphingobium umbonatum]
MLILGGARSGKSRFGQSRIEAFTGQLCYIATAQAFDSEMAQRIALHRADRGPRWATVEAPLDLPDAIMASAAQVDAILVDCLTLWLSNLMLAERNVAQASAQLAQAVQDCPVPLALVANEVGLGIVPDNALARRFRDEAGRLNQSIAQIAGEVAFLAAGLPLMLKG